MASQSGSSSLTTVANRKNKQRCNFPMSREPSDPKYKKRTRSSKTIVLTFLISFVLVCFYYEVKTTKVSTEQKHTTVKATYQVNTNQIADAVQFGSEGLSTPDSNGNLIIKYLFEKQEAIGGIMTDSKVPYQVTFQRKGDDVWREKKKSVTGTTMFDFPLNTKALKLTFNKEKLVGLHAEPVKSEEKCALLFFGLPKEFKNIVLPSIQKYILDVNPKCDIYAHAFDVKNAISNDRNGEDSTSKLKPDEIFLLTENVLMTTPEKFGKEVNTDDYLKYFPHKYSGGGRWVYPTSLENLLKQWYSIKSVWGLMEDSVKKKTKKGKPYYSKVGLFRTDVLYSTPIDINDGDAVIPAFANGDGFRNDRMFYGLYGYAKVWATNRYPSVKKYMKTDWGKTHCLHSERFMNKLIEDIPWETRPICFQRVRAGGVLNKMRNSAKTDCEWYPPPEKKSNQYIGCGEMKEEFKSKNKKKD
uniref:Uncharacterized protein n=1 Tax=Corethron hystrix TaxID=216773 RepID=A0A7S1FQT1_9STRA|mmetsp:Transcript_23867/g.54335  ORF Transcript_23867/g.54335 Transcript_23867/m.54335 type:complete len:470 (+) Transcript_23867:115-1524(+)